MSKTLMLEAAVSLLLASLLLVDEPQVVDGKLVRKIRVPLSHPDLQAASPILRDTSQAGHPHPHHDPSA